MINNLILQLRQNKSNTTGINRINRINFSILIFLFNLYCTGQLCCIIRELCRFRRLMNMTHQIELNKLLREDKI